MAQDFKKLDVWHKAKKFAVDIYKITQDFPREELWGGVTSQLRRASSSIGANLSEGTGRFSNKDFAHFLHMSLGSAKECEYFLELSKDLGYLNFEDYKHLVSQTEVVGRMLSSLIKKVRSCPKDSKKEIQNDTYK